MQLDQLLELITTFFYSISQLFLIGKSNNVGFDHSPTPKLIDSDIYSNLFTYAHLIDISYCISSISGIKEPFECDLACESRFPNVTLVYQWYYDDSVTGYIATTYSNIFNYNDTNSAGGSEKKKKTIIVSLRGTRSIFDSYTDIKVDMTSYSNLNIHLPKCGTHCKVHQGFYDYYLHTLLNIHRILDKELVDASEDYELLIVGHSMGGSVALLLALHYLDLGFDKLTVITMGQPLVGNKEFVNWVDLVMGSYNPPIHNSFSRKYFRVVHKDDIVATIPNSDGLLNQYSQFDNQIYLNCSSSTSMPSPKQVVDCVFGDNSKCIKRDFQGIRLIDYMSKDYFRSHNTYFRRLGMCGMKIK
ncbi:triacylglycerol lipase [Scheffersomyces coipomensis]|uniref:triacylglycerol lipase n=1 Tax=Scheffersomyces coipomensis TaxID=1788519 RepID=UPI00315D084E